MEGEAQKLATEFSKLLKETLTPQQQAEVIRLNDEEEFEGVCHTHDFCDANQVMIDAWEKINGKPYPLCEEMDEETDQAFTDLQNKAWDIARENNFYFTEN